MSGPRVFAVAAVLMVLGGLSWPLVTDDHAVDRETAAERAESSPPGRPSLVGSAVAHPVAPGPPVVTAAARPCDGSDSTSLEGVIRRWDGQPAARVEVYVVASDATCRLHRTTWGSDGALSSSMRTDSAGKYRLVGLPPTWEGHVVVRAACTYRFQGPLLRRDAGAAPLVCDVDLPAPATLTVMLASTAGESPRLGTLQLDSVRCRCDVLEREPDEPWYSGLSEDERSCRVQLSPGSWTLRAGIHHGPDVDHEVSLRSGGDATVCLHVPCEGVVRGRVHDPLGRKLNVRWVVWAGEQTIRVSHEPGLDRFRLFGAGREPGSLFVGVDWNEGPTVLLERRSVVPDGEELVLEVPAPRYVAFRVVDAPERLMLFPAIGRGCVRARAPEPLGEDRYRVEVFQAKPSVLALWSFSTAPLLLAIPALEPGQTYDLGALRLPAGVDVVVRVTDGRGTRIPDARVLVLAEWPQLGSGRTDDEGVISLWRMPTSPFLLRVEANGFPRHVVRVEPRARTDVNVVLNREGRLVVAASGSFPEDGELMVTPDEPVPPLTPEHELRTYSNAEEMGTLGMGLAPGAYLVHALTYGRDRCAPVPVVVREGETTHATIAVPQPPTR